MLSIQWKLVLKEQFVLSACLAISEPFTPAVKWAPIQVILWAENKAHFFPLYLAIPHTVSLPPVPKMCLLGILSVGFFLKQWPLFASIIL